MNNKENEIQKDLMSLSSLAVQKQTIEVIQECNDITREYGLELTYNQAVNLVKTRNDSLNANGRIEFGTGIIDKIIKEFCDSPYILKQNYEDILNELIEIFYDYKNDTMDKISDDELIKYMNIKFNGVCQGSLELLADRELYTMAENVRKGYSMDYEEKSIDEEEDLNFE